MRSTTRRYPLTLEFLEGREVPATITVLTVADSNPTDMSGITQVGNDYTAQTLRQALTFNVPDENDKRIVFDAALSGQTIFAQFSDPGLSANVGPTAFPMNSGANPVVLLDGSTVTSPVTITTSNGLPQRLFAALGGNVTLRSVILASGVAVGGDGGDSGGAGDSGSGGGGGAGFGGAIFFSNGPIPGSKLTLDNVQFVANQAIGGFGGQPGVGNKTGGGGGGSAAFGGGFGAGGGGGGGGGGMTGQGGDADGTTGGFGGANTQGVRTSPRKFGDSGQGTFGGGGGGGTEGAFSADYSGGDGTSPNYAGFGGGGGGGSLKTFLTAGDRKGGLGGFGGGGGGSGQESSGGPGGFGGGGGGTRNNQGGQPGFGGGSGNVNPSLGAGGGGAGMGGAIFAMNATLTLSNANFSNNSATGGFANEVAFANQSGSGLGAAVFAYNSSVTQTGTTFNNNKSSSGGSDVYNYVLNGRSLAVNGASVGKSNTAGQYTYTAPPAVDGLDPANLRIATGDINGDGFPDLILTSGPGTTFRVAVVSGRADQAVLVPAFEPFGEFTGGGWATAGDFDGNGRDEFVVAAGLRGGPRVAGFALSATEGIARRFDFFGIDDVNFRGGTRIAAGDLNGDGRDDLIVAAGQGGGPRIALWEGTSLMYGGLKSRLMPDFFAFDASTRGGSVVAAGDVDGDGRIDLIFGTGGGAAQVKVWDAKVLLTQGAAAAGATPLADFLAPDFGTAGVHVTAKDADGDGKAEVVVGSGPGASPRARVYSRLTASTPPTSFQELPLEILRATADGIVVG